MSSWENFIAPNLGLLFYKHIYQEQKIRDRVQLKYDGELNEQELIIKVEKDEKTSPFDGFYNDLYHYVLSGYTQIANPYPEGQTFTLQTTYPGLLSGSGYAHDTKAKGDFSIGFFFDHTTGQPIIPGSSVKGVLKSVFELDVDKSGKNFTGSKSLDFVCWLLKSIDRSDVVVALRVDPKVLNEIKQVIFGDEDNPGKDVFLDAVLNIDKARVSEFLSHDFITPHHDNPLKNPIPIQFLKVKPEVAFEFRFKLGSDRVQDNELWNDELKTKLFKQILMEMGIGAKTNVGYGQLTDELKPQSSSYLNEQVEPEEPPKPDPPRRPREYKETIPQHARALLKSGERFSGSIAQVSGDYAFIVFDVAQYPCEIRKNFKSIKKKDKSKLSSIDELTEGDEVIINVNNDYKFPVNLNCGVKLINK